MQPKQRIQEPAAPWSEAESRQMRLYAGLCGLPGPHYCPKGLTCSSREGGSNPSDSNTQESAGVVFILRFVHYYGKFIANLATLNITKVHHLFQNYYRLPIVIKSINPTLHRFER